jgi:pilus assembly protein CpaB
MRMKSLILIFIALGCGLVASIGISQVMDRGGPAPTNMEMEQILVALTDIDIGAKLDANNVKLEDWPRGKVPEGAIRRLDQVTDKYTSARFYRGEALHASKVTNQPGNVAIQIPDGYRAMPVKVEEDTVMRAISPGDRVDVMVFLKRNTSLGITDTGAYTILKNVRVFAVNTNTERAGDGKENTNFRTVSLLVKPDHARELVVASQVGKINLTLRHPDERDDLAGDTTVTPIGDILRGHSKIASEPLNQKNDNPTPLLDHLRAPGDDGRTQPPQTKWTMQVMGPAGVNQFDWPDLARLPVQSRGGSAAPPAPAPPPPPSVPSPPAGKEGEADGTWNVPAGEAG